MMMRSEIYNLLRRHSDNTSKVNSIIISAFAKKNNIESTINIEVRSHLIPKTDSDFKIVKEFLHYLSDDKFDFEDLIELFEFVISPSDKMVNGAVYTPKYIRDYIVKQAIAKSTVLTQNQKICDIACGCGGFLLTVADKIHQLTGKPYYDIFKENIFGIDITSYSVQRAKLLLTLFAILNKEDNKEFVFNIYIGNSIEFNWKNESCIISENNGFDIIVGNPPYVTSRNMDEKTLNEVKKLTVAQTGHPDLYIPFFQIGFELLNEGGVLGFITVNTFIKSINGRALRRYFADRSITLELINFGGEQVFRDRNTYTCLCFLNRGIGQIKYFRCQSSLLEKLVPENFITYSYSDLNHFDGWNLANTLDIDNFIKKVEAVGKPFKEIYTTKNGIATLKNHVYKFQPLDQHDEDYFFLLSNGKKYAIEKTICRDIVNANKLKSEIDLEKKIEKIIFPYNINNGNIEIIREDIFKRDFPKAYKYLLANKDLLAERDKGNRVYETWYAYGRRQSMDVQQFKLFFPHICEKPSFVISHDRSLLFYNGIAVISDNLNDLKLLQKIMSTRLFYNYIRATTKDYSSGYISMSRNYLKNFGVYQFTKNEKEVFLSSDNPDKTIEDLYNVQVPEMSV